ncbi:uncharacterized protein LOC127750956 [Frankliniella occidentalis]|uniref:Uncharacterized protein LOC127750956 n=1 Tax=Frankliniella occidentalis TaxID=133901 RepID=A0A9C6XSP3_FRAOC|nr:uncharacterized protein LOC127750956 [Frankliniella occidentalis]
MLETSSALVLALVVFLDPTRAQSEETTTAIFVADDPGTTTAIPETTTEPLPIDRGIVPLHGVTPGPTDLPLHTWERAAAAWKRRQEEVLAAEEEEEAVAEQRRLLRQRRQPLSWSGRAELSQRQAAALLAEELALRDGGVVDAEPPEETITTPPLMRRPVKRLKSKKMRRKELAVVPQPHMLDHLPSTAAPTTSSSTSPPEVTRVRRQHGPYAPERRSGARPGAEDDGPSDQDLEESRVKRHGHMGSTGPVHSFVKTDKHGHYKWGVRHHVGHHFA